MTQRRAALAAGLFATLPLALLAIFGAAAAGRVPQLVRLPFGAEALGVSLSLRLDGLAVLFGTLICLIGALVFVYGGAYLAGRRHLVRFFGWLTAFMLAMLGIVTAENLIALFIFWELTSITSWFLIGTDHERPAARDAALQSLLVTGGGGMAMLVGFVMLGAVAGSFELTAIAAAGEAVRAHALYVPILLLVAVGAFTKSAQVPFHFWLPAAMEAPTPVSAYLHSATMVKAGVFLLARMLQVLGGTDAWTAILGTVGTVTMLSGAVLAVLATDVKRILAYSTISALGSLVMLLGIGTPAAVRAAIVFLVAHALYKGALFMVGGIIDHETGTRDVERLGGLARLMPFTAVAAVAGALSLVSFGPVLSFAGKEMIVEAIAASGEWSTWLKGALYATSVLLTAAAALVAIRPFFMKAPDTVTSHDPSPAMWGPPLALALAGIVLGLVPGGINALLLEPAAASVHPEAAGMRVVLWHGVNAPLITAAVAIAAGVVLFRARAAWQRALRPLAPMGRFGAERAWRGAIAASLAYAAWQTRVLQNGSLRSYLSIVLVTLFALIGAAAVTGDLRVGPVAGDFRFYEVLIAAVIVAGGVVAVRSPSRLGSVAALGVVGYSVALLYILFSAPDVAMTQFLVETLTVILFVLVIYRLPRYARLTPPAGRFRDALIASISGGAIALLVLAALQEAPAPVLAEYFANHSVSEAHGRNIVNVILVDFRALDTLGEITVVAVAAVGVLALLRLRPAKKETS